MIDWMIHWRGVRIVCMQTRVEGDSFSVEFEEM